MDQRDARMLHDGMITGKRAFILPVLPRSARGAAAMVRLRVVN
jgi:hypothetical protein